jgi:excisionase family DNA binding protein
MKRSSLRTLDNNENRQTSCEPLLSTEEAARILRIHPRTLTRMAKNLEIPAFQIGRHWRFRALDLDKWSSTKISLQAKLETCP